MSDRLTTGARGACKHCGQRIYWSAYRYTDDAEDPWVHEDWTQHARPGEAPNSFHPFPAYDHLAEPKLLTITATVTVETVLLPHSVRDVLWSQLSDAFTRVSVDVSVDEAKLLVEIQREAQQS
jgi:hypothetical protein